jgi:hypothetical protein
MVGAFGTQLITVLNFDQDFRPLLAVGTKLKCNDIKS